jgi:hypothetical protein
LPGHVLILKIAGMASAFLQTITVCIDTLEIPYSFSKCFITA